jgi:membrane-associated phospholipid phosphatase
MMIEPDQMIHNALNSQVLPWYYWFFYTITWLGSASFWLPVLAGCIFINRWRKIAALLFIVILFSIVINEDIKEIVKRKRPGDITDENYFVTHSYSFPSGHTQTAFAIATILSVFIAMRYNLITYLLAIAVGVSRIYLDVHFFTDVIAGAIAGVIIGELAIYAMYRFGLCKDDGIFGWALRALKITKEKQVQDKTPIKSGILVIAFGFTIALTALFMSWFVLSLAIVAVTYLVIITSGLYEVWPVRS